MPESSRRQPQRIPPPITHGGENLDAEVVLRDFPGDAALALWKTVRSVRLWAELPPAERTHAFEAGAHERRISLLRNSFVGPAPLADLEQAAIILRNEPVDPAEIAEACRRVADWADLQGRLGTALEFMQAAALTLPSGASLAHAVARLARRRAEYARAESWYRRAISMARRSRDWPIFARSFLGLGIVYIQRGNLPAAKSAFLRALRSAKRHSLREPIAMAYHELAGVAIRTESVTDVVKYARAALEAYGSDHPRLPALAHDIAAFWLKRGYFAEALQVFRSIPQGYGEPADHLARVGSLARAAGAVGDLGTFTAAWEEAALLLANSATGQIAATVLLGIARGAESLERLDQAEELAERSRKLAEKHGEAKLLFEAESVLESVRRSRQMHARAREEIKRAPRQVESLTSNLVVAMHKAAGAL